MVYPSEIYINGYPVSVNRNNFGNKQIISFKTPSNAEIIIHCLIYQPNVVIYEYSFGELPTEKKDLVFGITNIYSMKIKDKKEFKISKDVFKSCQTIFLNVKSDNCYLKIESISSRSQTSTENSYYHQIIYNEPDDYYVNVYSYPELENAKEPCVFYTYPVQKTQKNDIFIIDGVNYKIKLSEQNNYEADFFLAYVYPGTEYSNAMILNFFSSNDKDVHVTILHKVTKHVFHTFYFHGQKNLLIPNETINRICDIWMICNIYIAIKAVPKEDIEVDFSISTTKMIFQYLPRNKMLIDKIADNYIRVFYTYVNEGDLGAIKFMYHNQGFLPDFVTFKANSNQIYDVIPNHQWYTTVNHEDDIEIVGPSGCSNGCVMYISILNPIEKDYAKYFIFYQSNQHYIEAMINEKIKGYFYYKENYIFRFSLSNISKFHVVYGGAYVEYQLRSVDSSYLKDSNEGILPEEGGTFYDYIIGDGTSKYDITIEIIATSKMINSLVSYFEITVLPYEYSEYPLYHISDGESINCYTGSRNSTYILKTTDFNPVFYTFTFTNKQPKNFIVYYEDISEILEEQRHDIDQYINYTSESSMDRTGIIYHKNITHDTYLLKVETDVDTKFTYQMTTSNNELHLLKNEPRLFVILDNQTRLVVIYEKDDYNKYNNTLFVLEIEHLLGEGSIDFFNINKIKGKHFYYLKSAQLNQKFLFKLINEGSTLYANVKLSVLPMDDDKKIKLIEQNKTSNYELYENPFPLLFGLKSDNEMTSINLSIRLRNEFASYKSNYNFDNLHFTSFYTDKESYDNYNSNHTVNLNILKQIEVNTLYKQPIVNIEISDLNEFNKYAYLIIKIEEKTKTDNWTYSDIHFDISPYITYKHDDKIYLTERRNHYNKMNKEYQLYVLQSSSSYVVVELASCSGSYFNFDFYDSSEQKIKEQQIITLNENGKEIIIIDNKEKTPILLNLSLSNSNSEYIIKYVNRNTPYKSKHFYYDNQTIQYYPFEKIVESRWDTIKDNFNSNGTISAVYYHYLYKEGQSKHSICNSLPSLLSHSVSDGKFNWTNEESSVDKVESSVIAYFVMDDEDFLVSFPPVSVDIISPVNLWYWVVAIFFVFFAIIILGTYYIYYEVKKRQMEIESQEQKEEMEKKSMSIIGKKRIKKK